MTKYSYKKLSKCNTCTTTKYTDNTSPDCGCTPKESCSTAFSQLLLRTLCDVRQIRINIESMYEDDPVGETKPLDPELRRLTSLTISRTAVNINDLIHLANPCDFVCDQDTITLRLAEAKLTAETMAAQLDYVNQLKSTIDERSLCLAEAAFTSLLRLTDLLFHNMFYVELLYKCNFICKGE